jgi:hypothetical protein
MINRQAVEQYLQVNNVAPTAPDQEIKEVLLRAKWHEDDVDTALTVLRENNITNDHHVDTLHQVFHSDERLKPETISALLGIDVDMSEIIAREKVQHTVAASSVLVVIAVATSLSVTFFVAAMWMLKMGPFYAT